MPYAVKNRNNKNQPVPKGSGWFYLRKNCQPDLFAFLFFSAKKRNRGFAPSSRREQVSTGHLHLDLQIWYQRKRKKPILSDELFLFGAASQI